MAVFNSTEQMSSTNNNSSSRPISVKPTTSTATPTSSSSSSPPSSAATELSQEQWLDLLRVLPHNSLINLRVALRQYLDENGLSNEELTAAAAATPAATIPILSSNNNNSSNSQANVHLIQPRRTILPAASTLVPSAPLSLDEMPQNSYGTDRYTNLLRQSLKLPPLLKSVAATTASAIDAHNGLDTLAAAALASTNSETHVTPSSAVTVLQGKPMPGTSMVANPIATPAIIGGFKQDPTNQRQSPTIRETPKRLAATRAEAEQLAAAALALSPTTGGGGAHFSTGASAASKRIRGPEVVDSVDASQLSVSNLLLSNGSSASVSGSTDHQTVVKPDPEAYQFQHQEGSDGGVVSSGLPVWPSTPLGSASNAPPITADTSRRRSGRDESMTDDEEARRMKRRERNRVAAAKCRQNRQNQIEDLKARRKALEDESNQTRQLLQTFRHEKQQLEELLKKHAHCGCPTAAQYFQNGTLLLRLPASSTSAPSIRIIQPTHVGAHILPAPTPSSSSAVAGTTILPMVAAAAIKQEAPSANLPPVGASSIDTTPPKVVVSAVQRPNTLSISSLDSLTAAAQLWSPSITSRIKTPGGESWVNSQIGPPPSTIKIEKEGGGSGGCGGGDLAATLASATILSTPDILHQLGISLAATGTTSSKPIHITLTGGSVDDDVTDQEVKVTTAS